MTKIMHVNNNDFYNLAYPQLLRSRSAPFFTDLFLVSLIYFKVAVELLVHIAGRQRVFYCEK